MSQVLFPGFYHFSDNVMKTTKISSSPHYLCCEPQVVCGDCSMTVPYIHIAISDAVGTLFMLVMLPIWCMFLWDSIDMKACIQYRHMCWPFIETEELSLYPSHNEVVGGVYWFHSVRPSVCPSVHLSVRPSVRPACRVRSVSSTVMDGFFSY